MKKYFIPVLIAMSAIISSCQKDMLDDQPLSEEIATAANAAKPAESPVRVKTKTTGTDIRTYTYNTDGWLVESASNETNTATYSYSGNTINYSIFYPGGALAMSAIHELNGIGLVTKTTTSSLTGYYTYNLYNQMLTHDVYFANGDVVKGSYYYSDGDLDSIVTTMNGGTYWSKTFTYINKANLLNNEVFGQGYFGPESKHLVKSMSTIVGGNVTTETYNYKIMQGKVVKVETIKNGVAQPETYYTYY